MGILLLVAADLKNHKKNTVHCNEQVPGDQEEKTTEQTNSSDLGSLVKPIQT